MLIISNANDSYVILPMVALQSIKDRSCFYCILELNWPTVLWHSPLLENAKPITYIGKDVTMEWTTGLAYFLAGVFLANGVPHFVNGISGRSFQSPFAKPPGVGESSPVINVIWGMINFVIGYGLLRGVRRFLLLRHCRNGSGGFGCAAGRSGACLAFRPGFGPASIDYFPQLTVQQITSPRKPDWAATATIPERRSSRSAARQEEQQTE